MLLDTEGIDAYNQVCAAVGHAPTFLLVRAVVIGAGLQMAVAACRKLAALLPCCTQQRPDSSSRWPDSVLLPYAMRRIQTTQDGVALFSLAVLLSSLFVFNQVGPGYTSTVSVTLGTDAPQQIGHGSMPRRRQVSACPVRSRRKLPVQCTMALKAQPLAPSPGSLHTSKSWHTCRQSNCVCVVAYLQMGGIDEAALDRLALVTELTKRIRVRSRQQQQQPQQGGPGGVQGSNDVAADQANGGGGKAGAGKGGGQGKAPSGGQEGTQRQGALLDTARKALPRTCHSWGSAVIGSGNTPIGRPCA